MRRQKRFSIADKTWLDKQEINDPDFDPEMSLLFDIVLQRMEYQEDQE